jgi:hypothetical protein
MISLKKLWNSLIKSFKSFEPEEYKNKLKEYENKSKIKIKKSKRRRKRLTKEEVMTIENDLLKIKIEGGKPRRKYFMNKYNISDTTFYSIKNRKHRYSTLKVL